MIFTRTERDRWRIPTSFNVKAQKSRIDKLIEDLIQMTGKVRSADPRHHPQYDLTDDKGIQLMLKDETGRPLANLLIGKKAGDSDGGFVRFADRDRVYFTDNNILSALSVYGDIDTLTRFRPRSFFDLKAIDQDKEQLREVAIARCGIYRYLKKMEREVTEQKDDTTTTTSKESYWVLSGSGREVEMDAKEMENFLRDITGVFASEVVDRIGNTLADMNKPAKYGMNLNNPGTYLVFKTRDGQQHNFIFGKDLGEDRGAYLYVQDDGLVYEVSKYNCDRILKWVDDLPDKVKK